MVRISEYKVRSYGKRGLEISLPKVWFDDNGLQPGDFVDFYRDNQDNLVIVPRVAKEKEAV